MCRGRWGPQQDQSLQGGRRCHRREYLPTQVVSKVEDGVETVQAYAFEVPMNNPEAVKVVHTGHNPGSYVD